MDGVKILRDYARFCRAKKDCHSCELYKGLGLEDIGCLERILKNTEAAAEIIERWAKAHPEKTYLQDFLEKFPAAALWKQGHPILCRVHLYEKKTKPCGSCNECWNEPMEGCSNG